jgi:predicted O-methyltransferase YrrM
VLHDPAEGLTAGNADDLDSDRMTPEQFELMHRLVDSPPLDLPLESWTELYDLTLAFEPDLVLELGRGYGNSTCVFTQAAQTARFRVISIGFDTERAWETRTAPRLAQVVGPNWFAPLTVLQDDIMETNFRPLLNGSLRTLVFWDAHGTEVAEAVFGRLMPALPKENQIVVDDIWASPERYGLRAEYQAGPLWSLFDELLPLWNYLSERRIEFEIGNRWISFRAENGEEAPARGDDQGKLPMHQDSRAAGA